MMIRAEIGDDGTLRIKDLQQWQRQEIHWQVNSAQPAEDQDEPNGSAILQAFRKADQLDFPRRSHEELLRELHELRGR